MDAEILFSLSALVTLVVAVSGAYLGWRQFRHSLKVDADAAQVGIATVESGSIANAFDGMSKLNAALTADGETLRKDRDECWKQLDDLSRRLPRPPEQAAT